MTYSKLNNIYDDGFNKYCSQCNECFPVYKVKLNGNSYNLHLNNQMHLRFFDNNTFKAINYREIKSIELNKDFKTITIYMSNYKDNITFTCKNACTVFNKLKFHLNTEFNKIAI